MRKRHQAILISSHAKKNILSDLSLNIDSYEIEQKNILNNYFKENINPADIDNFAPNENAPENVKEEKEDELEDISDEEENYISINSNIKVPPLGEQKGPYIKYEISEKAFLGGIPYDDYQIIPENKIKVNKGSDDKNNSKYNNKNSNDKKEERVIKVGETIEFKDIIEQMAYWAEELSYEKSKDKNKNKRKIANVEIPDINILQLLKLYPYKINEISDKIKSLEKEARDKNLLNENSVVKSILNDQENIINEKKQSINKLAKEFDRIHSITYGDDFSVIEFK